MADTLIRELCAENDRFYYSDTSITDLTGRGGFNKLLIRDGQSYKQVFASSGNTVICLRYSGDRDMETVLQAVKNYLARL